MPGDAGANPRRRPADLLFVARFRLDATITPYAVHLEHPVFSGPEHVAYPLWPYGRRSIESGGEAMVRVPSAASGAGLLLRPLEDLGARVGVVAAAKHAGVSAGSASGARRA
jgi:hypothetical protein